MARSIKKYGWIPDLPDRRDHAYAAPSLVLADLPIKIDLRMKCPPVLDQGLLGSCTANAIANAFRFCLTRQRAALDFLPSRLFIYYNERAMEGTINSDSGAQIRDGIKTVAREGVVPEDRWPYVIERFASKPGVKVYQEALDHQALGYQRLVPRLEQMKGCLASGFPFVFGFAVYEGFETARMAKTGVLNVPSASEVMVGGHAVLAVGYDDISQRILVQNSWSQAWGQQGYFTMPYEYIADPDLADDFWTLRIVEM